MRKGILHWLRQITPRRIGRGVLIRMKLRELACDVKKT
jgi:hypothetical protein